MPTLHAVIHGRVQGVNFRMSAAAQARRLSLKGWVRNLPDRTVETEAIGSAAALQEYLTWLHKGPPGALVTAVDAQWQHETSAIPSAEPGARYDSFEIRYDDE